jgi:hypothetical protein
MDPPKVVFPTDPLELLFPTDHAALDGTTPVVGLAPMAAPEGPTPTAGAAPMAAGATSMAAPEGPTPAALEGATSTVGVGPPLPFPGRRIGREQGCDPSRWLEQGHDPNADPPLPPLGPPVTADGRSRPTCITGNPFRIT